ncbi:MAG: hypothetical protein ACLQUY_11835 [Ktedonobacterales bacterium]
MTSGEAAFEERVLCYLRSLADPCKPPVGAGSFLLLYASQVEIVVWFDPAREHQRSSGEVLIPGALLFSAWSALVTGETLDLLALDRIAGGIAGAYWLLALLSLLPGVSFTDEPPSVCWMPGKEGQP